MTFEEAQTLNIFRIEYQDNCDEREHWGDEILTREEFFKVWNRRNETCDSLKKHYK